MTNRALVLIDLQNDFLPGGALEVPKGDQVIAVANRLQQCFDLVVATQDWHPANHGSFASNHPGREPGDVIELCGLEQTLWPSHCVQGSRGAELAAGLQGSHIARVFQKGTDPDIDSYSGFFDNAHRRATGLGDYLRSREVREVYLAGLATDYCVRFSAIDARGLGFRSCVVEDGCRGIDLKPGDIERALEEMRRAGVTILKSREIPRRQD